MIPPYRDLDDDPYLPEKRKRGIDNSNELTGPPGGTYRGFCMGIVFTLLVLLMLFALAVIVSGEALLDDFLEGDAPLQATELSLGNTQTALAIQIQELTPSASFTPSETFTPTPSATPTASPTALPTASRTPSQTLSPTATITPRPSRTPTATRTASATPRPCNGYDLFAENSRFPRLITLEDTLQQPSGVSFRMVFEPENAPAYTYFAVALEVRGTNAAFSQFVPSFPESEPSIGQLVQFTFNDDGFYWLNFSAEDALDTFSTNWNRQNTIRSFSAIWSNTDQQPPLQFDIAANYLRDGGVFMTIQWGQAPEDPVQESGWFQIC